MTLCRMKCRRWIPRLAVLSLAGALGLFGLNTVGLFIPVRDPGIYGEPRNFFTGDSNRVFTAEEFWRQAKPLAGEANRDYAVRVTGLVHDSSAYLYEKEKPELLKRNWRVPIYKNYLLWASRRIKFLGAWARGQVSWADRGSIYRYVFSDYRSALERGVALCDEQSVILMGLLKERGMATHYVSFSRHALVEAEVEPGVWWVLDPSLRTVLPYDVPTLCRNPDLIKSRCREEGKNLPTTELLLNSFAEPPPRPVVSKSVKEAHGAGRYYLEAASPFLIWILPAILLAAGLAGRRCHQRPLATEETKPV
ncbi:MAG TPA: hypothetical protein PKW12_08280 [Verrucomicrobiota bacterium]|nr:hypothetical protein [Verrucomicrobiota bacterium]